MTHEAHPPLTQRLQLRVMPAVFRLVNVPMRFVLGLPVATPLGKRLMLVHLTGRKTGRQYRQPVSYVRDGQMLLTPGGGRWKLNLVEGQPTHVRLRGHDLSLRPELVRDPAEVDRLLGIMSEQNPMIRRFVPIPKGADGHYDRARLDLAIRHGFRIVRWTPDDAATREAIVR
jgi:F420H(2)-dependent quinone reductase